MYYYCCLCILIVRPCILNVVYVFLLFVQYSYCCLCILIVVYVFLDAATLTEVFPCFFLGCKANARVILAKTEHGPHSSKIVVLFYVLIVLYCSMYCLCVNVYCHRVTTQLQLTNISYIISKWSVTIWFMNGLRNEAKKIEKAEKSYSVCSSFVVDAIKYER